MLQPARADVAELVDARDLKSLDGNVVRVRFPPSAPILHLGALFFCFAIISFVDHLSRGLLDCRDVDSPEYSPLARNKKKLTSPLVRKGAIFPFQTSAACWVDLLGYGSMIAEADFNPLHTRAKEALARLRRFHAIVAKHSGRYFPTFVMNDGAVAYRDLSMRTRSVTHDFLVRSWDLFCEIKTAEAVEGYPGARMVWATGFRMRGRRAGMDLRNTQFQSVMRRFQEKKISAKQAITEAAVIREYFDIAPQLQANFAFTKAYVAESMGSAGGLHGSNFFVDLSIFTEPVPAWIELGQTIDWSHRKLGLRTTFAAIQNLPPRRHVEGGPIGILDGLQIAQRLAQDPDVLLALRAAPK